MENQPQKTDRFYFSWLYCEKFRETSDVVVRPQFDEDDEKKKKEADKEAIKDLRIAEKIKSELKDIEETGKRQRIPARTVAQMLDTSTLENLASTIGQDTEVKDKDDLQMELERLQIKLAEVSAFPRAK